MKNSFYKITMFIFQLVIILLLVILCIRLNAFDFLARISWIKTIETVFNNSYIVNILCSIVSIFILYLIQINYSKHMLKKDFRCNEIVHDLYYGIERTTELLRLAKESKNNLEDPNSQEDKSQDNYAKIKIKAQSYYDFYIDHKSEFYICNLSLTYENNKILIDSVQSVFFINLNFKLLNIINNIKNRMPNLVKSYAKITELYSKYQTTNNEAEMIKFGHIIEGYLIDIKFMSTYIMDLVNYLKYDPLPIKLSKEILNNRYPTDNELADYFSLPLKEQNKINKEIIKEAHKRLSKLKIRTFFRRNT